jgi:glycogen synthase
VSLAFVAYETAFAPCGGVAAVMARLPGHIQRASDDETIVLTPFHHRIEKTAQAKCVGIGSFGLTVHDRAVTFHVLRHEDPNSADVVPLYFLKPEEGWIFNGGRHPYDVPNGDLLRDALVFGLAVPLALQVIRPGSRWTLLLQDWECATVAVALAGQPHAHTCYLTLHNSYDCVANAGELSVVRLNPMATPGGTILHRALSTVRPEVFTVSDQFALDLVEDTLQSRVIAPHLLRDLRGRLVGVDNGPFVDCAVTSEMLRETAAGHPQSLRQWKAEHRAKFLKALAESGTSSERPLWGNPHSFDGDDAPWFVMAGRDDPRQKGYDVHANAVADFLERGGVGKFLFFPIPGDEGLPGLQFLRRLAERFPNNVLVFPFLFREGFVAALRGAAFGVMPSLYEPFGMAHEFVLNGTVGIGRATGGIVQQIVPLRSAACFSAAVQMRAARWHAASAAPTGLLFRERDGLPTEVSDWAALNAGHYSTGDGVPDRSQARGHLALYRSMTRELRVALFDASRLVTRDPDLYDRMLVGGVLHIQQSFSWERAAERYCRVVCG